MQTPKLYVSNFIFLYGFNLIFYMYILFYLNILYIYFPRRDENFPQYSAGAELLSR